MDWHPGTEHQSEWSRMRSVLMTAGFPGSSRVRTTQSSAGAQAQPLLDGWTISTTLFTAALLFLCYIYWDRIALCSQKVWRWVTKRRLGSVNSETAEKRKTRKSRSNQLLMNVKRLEVKVTALRRALEKHNPRHHHHQTDRSGSPALQRCSRRIHARKRHDESSSPSDWESAA